MYRTAKTDSPHQVILDGLKARLRSLDLRIARMRALHAGSVDPLARPLITHSFDRARRYPGEDAARRSKISVAGFGA